MAGAALPGAKGQVDLPLTPMVDMFVILVVFLLQFFAASGQTLNLSSDTVLPSSSSTEIIEQAVQIEVTRDFITLEGVKVANVADLTGSDLKIPGLHDGLSKLKAKTENLAARGSSVSFDGKAILIGDKHVKYDTITRIMFTCGNAGYGKINMAVMQKGGT
jgi:biopolymer transport protein ExbD